MLSSFSSCSASISALGHTDGAYVEDVSGVCEGEVFIGKVRAKHSQLHFLSVQSYFTESDGWPR